MTGSTAGGGGEKRLADRKNESEDIPPAKKLKPEESGESDEDEEEDFILFNDDNKADQPALELDENNFLIVDFSSKDTPRANNNNNNNVSPGVLSGIIPSTSTPRNNKKITPGVLSGIISSTPRSRRVPKLVATMKKLSPQLLSVKMESPQKRIPLSDQGAFSSSLNSLSSSLPSSPSTSSENSSMASATTKKYTLDNSQNTSQDISLGDFDGSSSDSDNNMDSDNSMNASDDETMPFRGLPMRGRRSKNSSYRDVPNVDYNQIAHLLSSNKNLDFNLQDISCMPKDYSERNLGDRAWMTLYRERYNVNKTLEQLHKNIVGRPSEDQLSEPLRLKTHLMAHQKYALTWMKWREQQKPKGGILADDMGLGKTFTMIALILDTLDNDDGENFQDRNRDDICDRSQRRPRGGTLVICPPSLINQWAAEIKKRVRIGYLTHEVHHGSNRSSDAKKLASYDVVITTYHTLAHESKATAALFNINWKRVILDEAHVIRNHKTSNSLAVCQLTSIYRWAMTGTPIQNRELDLYAVLKFLQCEPFDDLQLWRKWVDNRDHAGTQRLIIIMKAIMLRRTKAELDSLGIMKKLPEKKFHEIGVKLDKEEDRVYKKILLYSQSLFGEFLQQREERHESNLVHGRYRNPAIVDQAVKYRIARATQIFKRHNKGRISSHVILVLILRLRQIVCHPYLIHSMLDQEEIRLAVDMDDAEDNEPLPINPLTVFSMCEDSADELDIDEDCAKDLLKSTNPVFEDDRRGSKVRAILTQIREIIQNTKDKLVVVSQWTSFLNVIQANLPDIKGATYEVFSGEVAVCKRQEIIETFNKPHKDPRILLLSLTCGGVGINLTGANHLLLIDIHWKPQLEAQATDRVHRLGQTKDVNIYKFICTDTIETKVQNIQNHKLEIADNILNGARTASTGLTIEDLKLLFS